MEVSKNLELEDPKTEKLLNSSKIQNLGRSTIMAVTFNTINTIVGGGILALPYTVYQSGFILGLISIILSLLASIFSIFLLAKCIEKTGMFWYASIGYQCHGKIALYIVNGLI